MYKYLSHCPRCSTPTTTTKPKVVQLPIEMKPGKHADKPPQMNTEVWVEYNPCGCTIPPEEHQELIGE